MIWKWKMHINSILQKRGHRLSVFNRIYHLSAGWEKFNGILWWPCPTTPGLCRCVLGRSARFYNTDETVAVFSKWLCKEDCKGKRDISWGFIALTRLISMSSFMRTFPVFLFCFFCSFFLPRGPLDLYITKQMVHGTQVLLIFALPEIKWYAGLNLDKNTTRVHTGNRIRVAHGYIQVHMNT